MGVSVSVSPPGAGPDVSYRKKTVNIIIIIIKKQNEPNGTIKNGQAKKLRSTLYRLRRELLKKRLASPTRRSWTCDHWPRRSTAESKTRGD